MVWIVHMVFVLTVPVSGEQLSMIEFIEFCMPNNKPTATHGTFAWKVEIFEKVAEMCGMVFSDGFFTNLKNFPTEYDREPIKIYNLIRLEPGL